MKPSFVYVLLVAIWVSLQKPTWGFLSFSGRDGLAFPCCRELSLELAAAAPLQEESDIDDMNDLIKSFSLEEDDEIRRKRVTELFAEKYSDIPFCSLFDEQLIVMGDVVKKQAAENMPDPSAVTEGDSDSDDSDSEQPAQQQREKSPEEKQLWALVDMMIQSKTLVKRARDADAKQSS